MTARLLSVLRALGPWVFVHALFISLAVGTSWYVYAVVLSEPAMSGPLAVALVGEVAMAVVLSTLHVFTRLWR